VDDGEHSLAISLKSESEGLPAYLPYSWEDPEGLNVFGYEELVFRMLVTESEQDPELILTPVTGDAHAFHLGDQLGDPGTWQEIRIPLDGLAEADFRLKSIAFQASREQMIAPFYVDNIRLVPEEVEEPSPEPDETAVDASDASAIPSGYGLSQNIPNPFNPFTTIGYDLPQASNVTLTLYTITGQKVSVLVDAYQQPGHHRVLFDGSGYANGVYLYCLEAGSFVETKRMMVLK
jgi:hypothetical protein